MVVVVGNDILVDLLVLDKDLLMVAVLLRITGLVGRQSGQYGAGVDLIVGLPHL